MPSKRNYHLSVNVYQNITEKLRRISTWLTIRAIEMAQEEDLCVEEKRFVLFVQIKSMHVIDYKDVNKLKRYVSERGKILPRRITGNCAKHQRALTVAVKRARHVAIMPYTTD